MLKSFYRFHLYTKTQIINKIKYDLKGHFHVTGRFRDVLTLRPTELFTNLWKTVVFVLLIY